MVCIFCVRVRRYTKNVRKDTSIFDSVGTLIWKLFRYSHLLVILPNIEKNYRKNAHENDEIQTRSFSLKTILVILFHKIVILERLFFSHAFRFFVFFNSTVFVRFLDFE